MGLKGVIKGSGCSVEWGECPSGPWGYTRPVWIFSGGGYASSVAVLDLAAAFDFERRRIERAMD